MRTRRIDLRLAIVLNLFSDEGHALSWRDNCHCSIRAPILERPVLDIQNPSASRIHRRGDRSISNRDDTLSCSKLAPCPEADIAARCFPLKHDKSLEGSVSGVAAIDLELVRLNGSLIFPPRRYLIGLDKFDVGIRVIIGNAG